MDVDLSERNGLRGIIDEALGGMGFAPGGPPGPGDVSLAEFARRTGLTRSRARTIGTKGPRATRRGRRGAKARTTVTAGHASVADALPRKGSPTRPSSRTPSARAAASAASAREGPHQAPRAPGAREEGGRRPAGKPRGDASAPPPARRARRTGASRRWPTPWAGSAASPASRRPAATAAAAASSPLPTRGGRAPSWAWRTRPWPRACPNGRPPTTRRASPRAGT